MLAARSVKAAGAAGRLLANARPFSAVLRASSGSLRAGSMLVEVSAAGKTMRGQLRMMSTAESGKDAQEFDQADVRKGVPIGATDHRDCSQPEAESGRSDPRL